MDGAIWFEQFGIKYMEQPEAGEMTIDLPVPKDLLLSLQQPLITCWWMIRCLAALTSKYLDFFFKMAKGVQNMKHTSNKENTLASKLLSLASLAWIIAVQFLSANAKSFMNPQHM
jgi:hypothetical protein